MADNGISTLATKQAKQAAKLALAATKRAAKGLPSNLDISLLPTQYSNNTLVLNSHASGLAAGRPWTSTPAVSYSFGTVPTSLNEGQAGTFNVTTTGVANGTTLYWTIVVDGFVLKTSDFSATSGSFTITSNAGSFTVTPANDQVTDYTDTFEVKIRTGSTSGPVVATSSTVTINDTSIEPWRPLPTGMTVAAPLPASGAYAASQMLFPGTWGTPYSPVTNGFVPNSQVGINVKKYKSAAWTSGNFSTEFSTSFFSDNTKGPLVANGVLDPYLGFGEVTNLPDENNYTMMWEGYIQMPAAGTYNIFAFCQGDVAWWVGSDALAPTTSNINGSGTGTGMMPLFTNNSFTVTAGTYLPFKAVYVNYSGNEQCQFLLHDSASGSLTNGSGLTLRSNSVTNGL